MLIIDTHAHLYAEDELQYPPAENPLRPPTTTGTLAALKALAIESRISAACAVQTFSFYHWDNRYLCDVSKAHPTCIAGVCLLNPDNSDSPGLLEHFVTEFGIRGLRSYPAADGRLDHPGVRALWRKAEERDLVVNASVDQDCIDDLISMASSFPRLPIVVDHCLITRQSADLPCILKNFLRLARFSNVFAKLSFLPLGSSEPYPYRDMHEPCRRIIAAFGPERCVWGNVFPCGLWSPKSTYAQNLQLFTRELNLGDSAKACILGGTANRLWFNGRLSVQ